MQYDAAESGRSAARLGVKGKDGYGSPLERVLLLSCTPGLAALRDLGSLGIDGHMGGDLGHGGGY